MTMNDLRVRNRRTRYVLRSPIRRADQQQGEAIPEDSLPLVGKVTLPNRLH
jgi:hypothetical protein